MLNAANMSMKMMQSRLTESLIVEIVFSIAMTVESITLAKGHMFIIQEAMKFVSVKIAETNIMSIARNVDNIIQESI